MLDYTLLAELFNHEVLGKEGGLSWAGWPTLWMLAYGLQTTRIGRQNCQGRKST
jgi:hypothetical protein